MKKFLLEMNRKKVITIALNMTVVLFSLMLFPMIEQTFRNSHWNLIIFWLFIPLIIIMLRCSNYKVNEKLVRPITIIMTVVVITLSILVFINHTLIRDDFGYKFIKGYYTFYIENSDEIGRMYMSSEYGTSTLLGKIAVWLFNWLVFILCITMPIVTWKQSNELEFPLSQRKNKETI